MQIRHLKTVVAPAEGANRVSAVSWSANNQKLATVAADKVIQLFDDSGEKKDKFNTKPTDPQKNTKPYTVVALAFSPDSTKLAVAQSDCGVFIYKLGLEWGEKKSICNKFIQNAEVTTMVWPKEQHNSLVFGLSDGKVRLGSLKTNKSATLYQTESCVVSLADNIGGNAIISGHEDGSINRFFFDDSANGASQGKFTNHRCAPQALVWGEYVVAAGVDRVIVFYDKEGRTIQSFDYSHDEEALDFTSAAASPTGQSIVIGSFNRIHIFNFSSERGQFEEAPIKVIENFYTVTALAWKPDGSRLTAANMCGAVELFDCCLKKARYKGKFEFTYVSGSQVIVKRLSTGARIILKSHYGYEITKINIFQDKYLIANTSQTLMMGDLNSCKLSEIPWTSNGSEKYYFENSNVCMVFNAGELSFVEYGVNEMIGSCRTEYMNPHLISVRINARKSEEDIKRVAYLVDSHTLNILDLNTSTTIASISHDSKIDWLELSGKANKLIFRDKRNQLHLFDVASQTRVTLLAFCSYVQWVPNSDVVVAQSRNNLCIWYSIAYPERVTMFPIKGEIENIERADGKTEVIVDEGVNTVSYTLDECLIEFGTSIDDHDYERAISLLETLDMSSEVEAMWKTLSKMALKDQKLPIAERCFAALGDVATSQYLRLLNKEVKKLDPIDDGLNHYSIRAKLAILDRQFKLAESIYLEQGKVEEAMSMYQEMHKWNLSIKVAETKNHPELETLKKNYYAWLIDSGQEDRAGEMREEEGDYAGAVQLYIKAGMPGRAYVVLKSKGLSSNDYLTEKVAASLYKSGLFEKAGELYVKIKNNDKAFEAFKKGKAFRLAVELSRSAFPQQVVVLEEQWGDYLVSQKQMDSAINHYIEAGKSQKAIEAAISCKQWKKAVGIIDTLPAGSVNKNFIIQIAKHFETIQEYPQAEKYYVLANKPQEAVDMYTKAGKWDKAHILATTYMNPEEVSFLYVSHARDMESQGKLKDAEKLYLTIGEPDLAINMYKNHKQYENMLRLVGVHHKDLLDETHLYLAKTLEGEGNLKLAEHHYVEAKDWKSAVNMYCTNSLYEEGYRVAKSYGGANSSKQVAYLWARSLGGEAAAKLLTKYGLLEVAIDYATDNGSFDFAFEMAKFADKSKLLEVHYKHAMHLEDEGKFKEAEKAFILSGKPKEAILMYVHNKSWQEAQAVAEAYDTSSLPEVLIGQANVAFEVRDFAKVESLMLRAQRPELVINLYKSAGMWKEAMKFAKEYLPNKLPEVHEEYDKIVNSKSSSKGGGNELLESAKLMEQQKDYSKAIDIYHRLTQSQVPDVKLLEKAWLRSVELAKKFCGPEKTRETILLSAPKLIKIKKPESAVELYLTGEMYKDAIDCCISNGLWEKSKSIAIIAPKFAEYIESAYVNHLKGGGHADKLVNVDVHAGLDMFAQKGDWVKCLDKAATQGPEIVNKYLAMYCTLLIKDSQYQEAVSQIIKYNVPLIPSSYDIYFRLSREILYTNNAPKALIQLREMLYSITSKKSAAPAEFNHFMIICHLMVLKNHCKEKKELLGICAKISIALLRYTKDIQIDKAFYEAGLNAKMAGMNNMAFVTWNRFLDISDAIEEGDISNLETSDFENTDIPLEFALPTKPFPDSQREQVRDWILQISLDQKTNQQIDKRKCDNCQTSIYDAGLTCYNCKFVNEVCVVSGYPVLKGKSVKCSNCNACANKEDWNKYVTLEKSCPWCASSQTPSYSMM